MHPDDFNTTETRFDEFDGVGARFAKLKMAGVDDVPAAILVLADAMDRAQWALRNLTDSDGRYNVRISGDVETRNAE